MTDLPLNGRNFLQLLFLGAGAVMTDGEQGGMRQGVGSAISIMGARPTSNNFMLDGTANIDTSLGTVAAVLSIDAIQEFKEQTSTYSAEYGFSSNQINIISKSGTNAFHGSAFDFIRNEKLDARNFFDPADAPSPSSIRSSQGSSSAGPIFKNKTFFLVNYEGVRIERGFSSFNNVPTPDQLAGHFTSTIIDPTTGQPFPNNTIPQSRYSRLAQAGRREVHARAEHRCHAGQLPGRPDAAAGPGPVHDSRRPQSRSLRHGVRTLHENHVQQHRDGQRQRPRRHRVSSRTRRTGSCRTRGSCTATW